MADVEKLAQFFVKLTAIVFAVYAFEIIYLASFDVVYSLTAHAHQFPETSAEFILQTISFEIYRNAFFALFYVFLTWIFWTESRRISEFVLKRIK